MSTSDGYIVNRCHHFAVDSKLLQQSNYHCSLSLSVGVVWFLIGYCAALPPMEHFMDVSRNARRDHFFEVGVNTSSGLS